MKRIYLAPTVEIVEIKNDAMIETTVSGSPDNGFNTEEDMLN